MKLSKVLFSIIIMFFLSFDSKSAASEEESVGPLRVHHINEEGIGVVYTIQRIKSQEDLLNQFLAIPGIDEKAKYCIMYPKFADSFEAFKDFLKQVATQPIPREGRTPPTVSILQY